jgi:hypothetical protein
MPVTTLKFVALFCAMDESLSFRVAKTVVDHYFATLSKTPSNITNWYSQTAELDWMTGTPGTPPSRVSGKGSLHQFFKTLPEMIYEVQTYDCHTIDALPSVTMLVITGKAAPVGRNSTVYPFHTTMHLRMVAPDPRAVIAYQSFKLFAGT